MLVNRGGAAACISLLTCLLSACASESDLVALRQPPLPPLNVAKAVPDRALYHNVVVQQITGAPEFRWFDGGAVLTTRPTRVQVMAAMRRKLYKADMLAPDPLDADYLLNIDFADLHGPDVWIASDKLASASMTFTLVERRTGRVVRSVPVEASYQSRMGLTPEEVRAVIAGPEGVTKTSVNGPIGAAISLLLGYFINDDMVAPIVSTRPFIASPEVAGARGPAVTDSGYAASFDSALSVAIARDRFGHLEEILASGRVSPASAATESTDGRPLAYGEVSDRNGTARRYAATGGLMELLFDRFAASLVEDGMVQVKQAVSCRSLNPNGYRFAYVAESEDSYALDCPDARFNAPVADGLPASPRPFARTSGGN